MFSESGVKWMSSGTNNLKCISGMKGPESGATYSKALIGIFSQTAGSTYEFWVNPVNFTLSGHASEP
jgi:hypothetical protein